MVEAGLVAALKAECAVHVSTSPTAALWGDRSRVSSPVTPFAGVAGATAQAGRLLSFEGVPLVLDRPIVQGRRRDLDRRCIRLRAPDLGYATAGELVFVLGVEELENGTTRLAVLRRLA